MNEVLSRRRYSDALAFIVAEARPLDRALWEANHGGPSNAVTDALAAYQNPDGGFGHGIEPDLSTPASTAIATSVGLRALRRARVEANHPMVTSALAWLGGSVEDGVWPIINPAVNQAPHAPWWTWSRDLAAAWNGFRWNPSAELLAALYAFRPSAPAGLLEAAEDRMRRSITETELIAGAYDLRCARVLAEAEAAPVDLRSSLTDLLRRSVLALDPDDEHVTALDLAPAPDSLLGEALAPRIDPAIARLIAGQQDDGGWTMFWDWSDIDAAAWAKAKHDWRGQLTREALEVLGAHGRIEAG